MNGVEYRKSLSTTDKREAAAREKQQIADASEGKLQVPTVFAKMRFSEAVGVWIADRAPRLAKNSVKAEKERAARANEVLGTVPVSKLTPDQVLAYLRDRKDGGMANATLNRELDVIRGVLKRARRWHLFQEDVKPYPIWQDVGRVLSFEQKTTLLSVANSKPGWRAAYLAGVLALNTTARGVELKGLCWRDVDLMERTLTIRRSKTAAGERVVPLNQAAYKAILALRIRAQQLGGDAPAHYVFFACERGHFNPAKPQTSWRTAWRSIAKKAGLTGLRFHDLRHDAITTLAEGQASDHTIMSIAGHVSPKMLAHYSHIRMQAKREALDVLETRQPRSSIGDPLPHYSTAHSTKPPEPTEPDLQVIENMVELVGIEPTTSSLRTMRSPS